MSEIKPTAGRIVLYKDYEGRVFPSMITGVDEGCKMVNLHVFQTHGTAYEIGVAQGEENNTWDWMPFQKDQAARLAKENKDEVIGDTKVED